MNPYADVSEAWNAIYAYRVSADGVALADEHRAVLDDFLTNDAIAVAVSQTAEYAFARRADLPQSFLAMAGPVAQLATVLKIDNMRDERGRGITYALLRDGGAPTFPGFPWPDAKDDPAPRDEFASQSVDAVPPNPGGGGAGPL